jgi:hypothetical protein
MTFIMFYCKFLGMHLSGNYMHPWYIMILYFKETLFIIFIHLLNYFWLLLIDMMYFRFTYHLQTTSENAYRPIFSVDIPQYILVTENL